MLFSKENVNTKRQFEFDLAKAICILGMVFVHCFEQIAYQSGNNESSVYFIIVIVLDAIFGAGTFMSCMGVGIAYSHKNAARNLILRGLKIFILGYVLNIFRSVIPCAIFAVPSGTNPIWVLCWFLENDIMQFAGLALMLFGLLKLLKANDLVILGIAIGMSILGSFFRFIHIGNYLIEEVIGLFIGVEYSNIEGLFSPFSLLNWFIFPVVGYIYGKYIIRRCANLDKFYAYALPISALILAIYLIICIPNKIGMMSGDICYFYQMTTPEAIIILFGMVFATSVYHFVAKLIPSKGKTFITALSKNINAVYCIQWVIIGWIYQILLSNNVSGLDTVLVILIAVGIYVLSNVLAQLFSLFKKKYFHKKQLENISTTS